MADDVFLKLGDVKGDVHAKDHQGEIALTSFSWGVTALTARGGGGSGVGKVQSDGVAFSALSSSASPQLFALCTSGKTSKSAVITVQRPGDHPVANITITLSDVQVSSYHEDWSAGDDSPSDHVTLVYGKVTFSHTSQNAKGGKGDTVSSSWSTKSGK